MEHLMYRQPNRRISVALDLERIENLAAKGLTLAQIASTLRNRQSKMMKKPFPRTSIPQPLASIHREERFLIIGSRIPRPTKRFLCPMGTIPQA